MLTSSPLLADRSPPLGSPALTGFSPARRDGVAQDGATPVGAHHAANSRPIWALALGHALVLFCGLWAAPAFADGPADNNSETARRIPALGIEVPPAQREQLTAGLTRLQQAIEKLQAGNNPLAKKL
ncbi:MAG: hypothetical protein ACKO3P_11250, partial [Planctomycetaceae bacterium]